MIDSILYFYRQRKIFKLFIMPKQKAKSARAVSYKLLQVVDNSPGTLSASECEVRDLWVEPAGLNPVLFAKFKKL